MTVIQSLFCVYKYYCTSTTVTVASTTTTNKADPMSNIGYTTLYVWSRDLDLTWEHSNEHSVCVCVKMIFTKDKIGEKINF